MLKEDIIIPLKPGDTFLAGKFKNKRYVYASDYTNEKGDIIIITSTGKEVPACKIRLVTEVKEQFSESLKLSDFKAHSGVSDFTKPFMKDRQKIKGAGNKSAKLSSVKINKKKDYVTFIFKSKPTYSSSTEVVDPNTMSFKPGKVYTQQIRLLDFFALAETKPGYKINELSFAEVKEILQVADIQVWCSCGSFQFQGINNIVTVMDAAIYPEYRAPKRWNSIHNDNSFACKHLDLIFAQIEFFINPLTSMVNKILKS
jgi:hypothetical protein